MDGADCWGLVQLVYRCVLGVSLPGYEDTSSEDVRAVSRLMQREKQNWDLVTVPRRMDVVMMEGASEGHWLMWHVGVMVDSVSVMHIESEMVHPVVVALTHMSVSHRVREFWRHAS